MWLWVYHSLLLFITPSFSTIDIWIINHYNPQLLIEVITPYLSLPSMIGRWLQTSCWLLPHTINCWLLPPIKSTNTWLLLDDFNVMHVTPRHILAAVRVAFPTPSVAHSARTSWAVPVSRAPRATGNVLGLRLPRSAEGESEEVMLETGTSSCFGS